MKISDIPNPAVKNVILNAAQSLLSKSESLEVFINTTKELMSVELPDPEPLKSGEVLKAFQGGNGSAVIDIWVDEGGEVRSMSISHTYPPKTSVPLNYLAYVESHLKEEVLKLVPATPTGEAKSYQYITMYTPDSIS